MDSLSVLTFDPEGRPIQFDKWLDDLQMYLLSDYRDSILLFDLMSRASLAPPATADSVTCSQWLTRDAAACLAVRNHLPLAKHAHFGQHKTAKALYDAVAARYPPPATAALGRLILPYLFPEVSAFATVEDLVTHLRTSDTRYRAALPAKFLDRNPPSYVHHSLLHRVLTLPPCPLYASAAAVDILGAEDVEAASALSGKHCSSKGKGGKSGGGGSGGGDGGGSGGGGGGGGGGSSGSGGGSGGFGDGGGGSGGGGGGGGGGSESGGSGSGGGRGGAVQRGGFGGGQRQQQQCRSETPLPQQLLEWFAQHGASGGSVRSPYVIRTGLHLPSFSTNLVSIAALHDAMVTTTTPRGQRVSICTCTRTGRHLATFNHRPGSSLYTLTTEPTQLAASGRVSASSPVAAPYSCRLLSHQTLLWYHCLGHPSLPRLRGMHSRLLVSGIPRSLPPLPPSPALPYLPCIEGRQRAAPHSSSFPQTTAPL
ncbi:unnamed protein product [Closterium sp. NIES-53]